MQYACGLVNDCFRCLGNDYRKTTIIFVYVPNGSRLQMNFPWLKNRIDGENYYLKFRKLNINETVCKNSGPCWNSNPRMAAPPGGALLSSNLSYCL